MNASPSALRSAAAAFLAQVSSDVLAWEPACCARTMAVLAHVEQGLFTERLLHAALGRDVPERPTRVPKGRGVALLSLTGVLTPRGSFLDLFDAGTNVSVFINQLAAAAADPGVRAIVVAVDSGGGLVGMIPEAAAAMRGARDRKPVIATVLGSACSAAFWIVSSATRLEVTPSGLVGSIGVYGERVSVARRLQQDGVDVSVIASTPQKREGHPATVMGDDERAYLQKRVDETAATFTHDVALGRHVSTSIVATRFGGGRVVSATTALSVGMVDAVRTIDATIAAVLTPTASPIAQQRHEISARGIAPLRAEQTQRSLSGYRQALAARGLSQTGTTSERRSRPIGRCRRVSSSGTDTRSDG